MSAMVNSVLTNQFFLMFLAIATGLLIGKIKIGSFSLGVSGGIFTGIVIGYFVTKWAHTVEEGQAYYSTAKRILSTGVVAQAFFTFFLLLFLVAIGMKVGGSIGTIFKKYGGKFVVIGISIPVVSLIAACVLYGMVLSGNEAITPFETIGMYAGAMTTTPGYGTALDAAGQVDYQKLYEEYSAEDKEKMLLKIEPSGELTVENTPSLSDEQVAAYKEAAASSISLGYTVAFPIGVLVIVVMETILPKIFRIDMEKEKEKYQKELAEKNSVVMDGRDIGTCVLPQADVKVYLTASAAVRAKRRFDELTAKGESCDIQKIEADIVKRDEQDMTREIAPLKQAEDAVLVDSSDMSIDEVVEKILSLTEA